MTDRPDYGLDAPGLLRGFAVGGVVAAAVAVGSFVVPWPGHAVRVAVAVVAAVAAAYLLGMAAYMYFGSRFVKVAGRDRLLDLIPWAGGDSVLDVGCGRGLLLVAAAKRLTTGRAVGIDLWQSADQVGRPEATLANAAAEGVGDRVEVRTSDMRRLPFADGSFDAVVSHWAVHNLPDAADRATAVAEMARVLRPGGHVLIADIAGRGEYAAGLAALGFADVRVVVSAAADRVRSIVTFGSFRPATVVARKPVGHGMAV